MNAYANSQDLEYLSYLLIRKNDLKSKPNYMKLCQKKKEKKKKIQRQFQSIVSIFAFKRFHYN